MRYLALATDFDGTVASDGRIADATAAALERFAASGRRVVLVTGRQLDDLERVLDRMDLFHRVVAENGAVVYTPQTKETRVLAPKPPPALIDALRARGVSPIATGHVIVATWEPHQAAALDAIKSLGLELHVEFNKGAVMILPAGVTKRTGLLAALQELKMSPHNVIGAGDAENDHAFLSGCEVAVSVANAIPSLKERSDWTTEGSAGRGIVELVDRVLEDDLKSLAPRLKRSRLLVGKPASLDGEPAEQHERADRQQHGDHGEVKPEPQDVTLDAYDASVLVVGPSGSGKSTIAMALTERLLQAEYQLCVVDPEGDYEELESAAALGDRDHPPTIDEVERLLADPRHSVVATLLAVPMEDRPRWFATLLGRIHSLRASTGRPHWLVVDEAHHVLPKVVEASSLPIPRGDGGLLWITLDPNCLSRSVLDAVDVVIATEDGAKAAFDAFCTATGRAVPILPPAGAGSVFWRVGEERARGVSVTPARRQHQRHKRKYATGDLGEDRSFYFVGPRGAMHLRAQNLGLFLQMAGGVDDETWLHHLRAGDYSRWFRESIKDPALADEAAEIEQEKQLSPADSRDKVRAAVQRRYSATVS
jgi:hydroxymethylpyrimidine pyrophosphatase-like HAD family hydrolase/energy-coupling factor transporter ATP-binding protein EcfA2